MLKEFIIFPYINLKAKQTLPEISGIYFAVAQGQVFYIGQAINLRNRWQNHHRFLQLEAVNKKTTVHLFWCECLPHQLDTLEKQYIEYYCPILNYTKVPERKIVPSFQMLTISLKKLNERILGIGICSPNEKGMKTLVLGYLAAYSEVQGATTKMRTSLKAINNSPDSLFRWTETIQRRYGAYWWTRCNGIEIQLIPWFEERIMHNPSMYDVMWEKNYKDVKSVPIAEYNALRDKVKQMSLRERLDLAQSTVIGHKNFPWELGAELRCISGVEILCLTDAQLKTALEENKLSSGNYQEIQAIQDDPVPKLLF